MPTGYPFAYFHDEGCGGIAFYLKEASAKEPLRSDSAMLLDGVFPAPLTPVVCGSCGHKLEGNPKTSQVRAVH